MEGPKLTERIRQAPTTPGVYVWHARGGRPLYIGKASNLRSRLTSYPKTTHPRIRVMVQAAITLDWQETPTDIEALILESQLIKRYNPKFNIDWRDDKNYFLVAITDEAFPQVILTHQVQSHKIKRPVKEYLGPFTEGVPLKSTLRILRTLFPYCSCKQKHHVKCLNAHIGKCPGYCCLKTSATAAQKRQYAANIRAIRDILTGKRDAVIKRLEKEMKALGATGKLEQALDLQKKIERIRRVFQNALINARHQALASHHTGAMEALQQEFNLADLPRRIEGYDIAHIQETHAGGAMVVFTNGDPDKTEYRLFNIKEGAIGDVPQLTQVLTRRFSHEDWPLPQLIVVDGAKAQLNAVRQVLAQAKLDIPVVALTKNARHQADHIIPWTGRTRALENLARPVRDILVHVDSEAHRFSISHYRKRHRKQYR